MRIGWNSSVNLIHKWHKSMDEMQRVIRIVFIDFRKAFDLIDHNKLLQNIKEMIVRSVLIRWFASYLNERSHSLVKNDNPGQKSLGHHNFFIIFLSFL